MSDNGLMIALAPEQNRPTCCRVILGEAGGWDVRFEMDDRVVSVTHCADWHRVERICFELSSVWADAHTESAARR
jgi:hypothetical protein